MFLKYACKSFVVIGCYLCSNLNKSGGIIMSSSILDQRNRYAVIGVLMVILSLIFLFYMGSSLVSSTKEYLGGMQGVEIFGGDE